MRRGIVIGVVLVAIAFLFIGGPSLLIGSSSDEVAPAQTESPDLVTFEDSESAFWEYLSARQAHDRRSPINVIVRGDADDVVRLMQQADDDWEETDRDHFDLGRYGETDLPDNESLVDNESVDANVSTDGNETTIVNETDDSTDENATFSALPTQIPWAEAAGTTRWGYVDPGPGEDSYWTDETLQLEDGEYYGQRYHIRLYEAPNPEDEWVAMQAHTEHFDWFTLRHRVDGVEAAQSKVERDLMSIPSIDAQEDVQRIYLGNSRPSDSDGWATKIDVRVAAFLPVLIGLARGRTRQRADHGRKRIDRGRQRIDQGRQRVDGELDRILTDTDRKRIAAVRDRIQLRHFLLAGVIMALFLGVRVAGIALEATEWLTMHQIAGLLYPVIAVGIPVATYAIANGLERRMDAAVVASTALAAAIWIDYGWLGVSRLPLDVVLQRVFVVVALGLIAAGAARRATRERRLNALLLVGLAVWTLVLVGTLLGYL